MDGPRLATAKTPSSIPSFGGESTNRINQNLGGQSVQQIKPNQITFKQPHTYAPVFLENGGSLAADGKRIKMDASKKKFSMQSVSSGPIKSPLPKGDPSKLPQNNGAIQEVSITANKTYRNTSI